MKIEVGKTYKKANGETVKIVALLEKRVPYFPEDCLYIGQSNTGAIFAYKEDGTATSANVSDKLLPNKVKKEGWAVVHKRSGGRTIGLYYAFSQEALMTKEIAELCKGDGTIVKVEWEEEENL
jgi:hypothetical protein